MIQLIALDFDGTIAARKQPVDETMVNYINKWKERNIETVIVSGRPYRSLKRELEPIQEDVFIVSNNGNLIRTKNSEKTYYKNTFPKEKIRPIVEAMIARGIHPIFHVDSYFKGYDLVTLFDTTEREASYISFYENLYKRMTLEELLEEDILVIAGYTTADVFYDLEEDEALKSSGMTAHLLKSRDKVLSLIEIIGNTNKWNGLEKLAEIKGIDTENIVAFGDDMNDESMIEHAGIGVAMASAPDEVKKKSDLVCEVPPEKYGAFKLADKIINEEVVIEY